MAMSLYPDLPWSVDVPKGEANVAEDLCKRYIDEEPDALETGRMMWNTQDGRWLRGADPDVIRFFFARKEDWAWFKMRWG